MIRVLVLAQSLVQRQSACFSMFRTQNKLKANRSGGLGQHSQTSGPTEWTNLFLCISEYPTRPFFDLVYNNGNFTGVSLQVTLCQGSVECGGWGDKHHHPRNIHLQHQTNLIEVPTQNEKGAPTAAFRAAHHNVRSTQLNPPKWK